MANKVTMNICGQEYTLVADESAAYMEKVGALVDERMRQVLEALHVSQTDAAVLAAVWAAFILWTFAPPDLPLFADPETGLRGIR